MVVGGIGTGIGTGLGLRVGLGVGLGGNHRLPRPKPQTPPRSLNQIPSQDRGLIGRGMTY